MAGVRTKTGSKAKPIPAKNMLQVGEIRYIKQSADKFLIMLSEVGDIDRNREEWVEEATALMHEFVLKTGRELGLQCYEEIMKVLIFFLETHNKGKLIGMGASRKSYEKWRSHQKNIDEQDRSDFQRQHPYMLKMIPYFDSSGSLFDRVIAFFDGLIFKKQSS